MLEGFQQKRYETWRDEKLANYQTKTESLFVEISNPLRLSSAEKSAIVDNCQSNNLSLIRIKPCSEIRKAIHSINTQLGLIDVDYHPCSEDDGLVVIEDAHSPKKGGYIPYSNKALNWHTDGYYNQINELVGAFSLYCIQSAVNGGENHWIDPEMLYIHLREQNPDIVSALTQPNVLTIPARNDGTKVIRTASIGPVFFIDSGTQKPKMRFTQRKRNIQWLESNEVKDALNILKTFLASNSSIHHQYKLKKGEGMICNNVLHSRSSFIDNDSRKRMLLRGRYTNTVGHC